MVLEARSDIQNCKNHCVDLVHGTPNAGLIKCNSTNICAKFSTVLTATARRAVPRR